MLTKGVIVLPTLPGRGTGGWIDSGLLSYESHFNAIRTEHETKLTYPTARDAANVGWTHTDVYAIFPGTGYYFPAIYFPQAVGLGMGRACGWPVSQSYRLARFAALLTSMGLLYWAFRLAVPNLLTLAILSLPMMIFQLGAASIDGLSTAIAVFSIAVFRTIARDGRATPVWRVLVLAAALFVLIGCRLHVLPMVALIFASSWFMRRWDIAALGVLVTIALVGWVAVAVHATVDSRVVGSALPPSRIAFYYFLHPLAFFSVIFETVRSPSRQSYWWQSFLACLAWDHAFLSLGVYRFLKGVLLVCAGYSMLTRVARFDRRASGLLLFSAVASGLMIFFLLLCTWTPHPATYVIGVQGRYFTIPALLIATSLQARVGDREGELQAARLLRRGLPIVYVSLLISSYASLQELVRVFYMAGG